MTTFRTSLLATAALMAGIASAPVQASTFASAILDINNFRLLHANGTAYSTADFTILQGTNDAHATASLNGVFANGTSSIPILTGTPNVAHQCVGGTCGGLANNDFTPFASPPPVPGTFGYADQDLTGASITIGAAPAGAHARTRADASTALNAIASGNSDVGTSTTFQFTLGAADTMTVSFDASAFTQAYVSPGSGPDANANARLSWSINIVDLTTQGRIFDFAPDQLNAFSVRSRTDGSPGILTYTFATPLGSPLTKTSGLLSAGTSYQITIQHNTLANALQQELPEPDSMAVLAAGMLAMSLALRRRKS
ncbi:MULTISPECIES: EDSAP-1 family PEP-CTERM protein [unclassified Duganella]|uniref:EDSAP-1 family PEP-CTERM protein n=1 Tax=unclassified Duganella TaxID=2636909 RepID=UPI0006FCCFF0|nr:MULTISPECIES: EDSAP-1 family PEP-CTERM protein [unclassified Duganella]